MFAEEGLMARADVAAAVADLGALHAANFGGKRMGRFTLNREQVAELLRVKVAHDKTIRVLSRAALNDADLVLAQSGGSLYSVVAARKATRWRKVPRAVLADLVGPLDAGDEQAQEDTEEGEDGED
jgi:hypothetical protein